MPTAMRPSGASMNSSAVPRRMLPRKMSPRNRSPAWKVAPRPAAMPSAELAPGRTMTSAGLAAAAGATTAATGDSVVEAELLGDRAVVDPEHRDGQPDGTIPFGVRSAERHAWSSTTCVYPPIPWSP